MSETTKVTPDYSFDEGLRLQRVAHILPTSENAENGYLVVM